MSAQLHTYVIGRLVPWAVWYNAGRHPAPARVISWWGPCVMARNIQQIRRAQPVHVDQVEAIETDAAVDALIDELRSAVHVAWIRPGTMEQKARDLGIERRALYYRRDRAYAKLLGYFNDQAAGIPLPVPDRRLKNNLTSLHKVRNIRSIVA